MGTTPPSAGSVPTGSLGSESGLLSQAAEYVSSLCAVLAAGQKLEAAIILGSGLGGLADQIDDPVVIPYAEIPGFGTSSAGGHRGELILGRLESTPVIAMAGRFHRYEGWSNQQIAFPVKLMARLGAEKLIVSNAAGGVSPKLSVGDIVVIRDHLNFMGTSDFTKASDFTGQLNLSGAEVVQAADSRSPRGQRGLEAGKSSICPGLARAGEVYDSKMSAEAVRIGVKHGFNVYPGTYLATLGPNYETRSEYRMMRRIGADVAGMSTVPEVLAALAVGMRILGLSMVSNVANPDQPIKTDHLDVLEAGASTAVKLERIVRGVLRCP